MRTPTWVLPVLVVAGCKGEPFRPDAAIDAELDAYDPPWWTPAPGEAANWDIQLADPFNVSAPRTMYDVDLWQVTPAKTITYADTSTIAVPAGAHAGAIDQVHALSPKPVVICHLRVGSVNLASDPDRTKFPGYETNPPDNPTAPKAGSAIGWSTGLPAGERWLDIRSSTRSAWAEVLEKRVQLAKDIGCDGVDVDRGIPSLQYGFGTLDIGDIQSFLTATAKLLHDRELSGGVRVNVDGVSDVLNTVYDWLVIERCVEQLNCDSGRPFTNVGKAVLAIDYMDATPIDLACQEWPKAMIRDGLLKKADPPAGDFRMVCP